MKFKILFSFLLLLFLGCEELNQYVAGDLYVITFNANSGQGAMQPVNFQAYETVSLPFSQFSKEGHRFIGWSTSSRDSNVDYVDGSTISTGEQDIELFAVWDETGVDPTTYVISFDSNSGEGYMGDQYVTSGDDIILSENIFTLYGYTFLGWSTSPNGSVIYYDQDTITIYEDLTLYAVWSLDSYYESYTITFDNNSGSGYMSSLAVDAGDSITLSVNTFTNSGASFLGWAESPNGEVLYGDESIIQPVSDITLYAIWNEEFTNILINTDDPTMSVINFNPELGSGEMDIQYVSNGEVSTLVENTFTAVNHDFIGWSTTPNGVVEFLDGATITIEDDIELYAIWDEHSTTVIIGVRDPEVYTISYSPGAGTGIMDSQDVTEGESIQLAINSFVYTGYEFIGWSTLNGGDVMYVDGESIYPDSDLTLYAVWEGTQVSVIINPVNN